MFQKLTIRRRLYGGFGLVVCLAAVGGTVAWTLLNTVDNEVDVAQRLSINAIRNLEIGRDIETMRKSTLGLMTSVDEQAKGDFRSASDQALGRIKEQADKALSATRRASYREVETGLAAQRDNFDKLALLVESSANEKKSLATLGGTLTDATASLLTEASKLGDAGLTAAVAQVDRSVLLVRIANWRFLATMDAKGVEFFKEAAARTRTALKQLSALPGSNTLGQGAISNVEDGLGKYEKAFTTASEAIAVSNRLYQDTMRPAIAGTVKIMDDARASLLTSANEARIRADDGIDQAKYLEIVAVLVILVLGAILAITICNSIARPLGAMNGAMRKMAEGNTETEVPGLDRRDEIGDMAQALRVFKENMIERQRLAERERAEQAEKSRRAAALTTLNEGYSSAFQQVGIGIVDSSVAVDTDSKTLTTSAQKTKEQAEAVAQASTRASNNVATVASAAEELRASINEINQQVLMAAKASTDAVTRRRARARRFVAWRPPPIASDRWWSSSTPSRARPTCWR
ncbi:MAG: methyl-accepting chemotaxis protein [Pseudomonadota bacterium]